MADSRRINANIREEDEKRPAEEQPPFGVYAVILSSEFWPPFKDEKLEVPEDIREALEVYCKKYEKLKVLWRQGGSASLTWPPLQAGCAAMLDVRPVATVPLAHAISVLGLRVMVGTWVATQPTEYPCLCFLLVALHLPAAGWSGGCMALALEPESLSVALLPATRGSCGFCFRFFPADWGSLLRLPSEPRGGGC